jgi:diguanylate cyclase (GGDEF)-like protein
MAWLLAARRAASGVDGATSAAQDVPMGQRFGLPLLGSPAAHRLDGTVTAVISGPGGLLMLAVVPLVPHQRLMAGAGLGAVLVAIWAWSLPARAGMWQRHAYTAASVPTTVLGTAAAEMSTGLRLGPTVLLCPLIAVACLRHRRSVMGQLAFAVAGYGAYVFLTLPPSSAVVGLLAGGAALTMVTIMVSVLRTALDNVVAELRQQAERDPLTGLLNRHGLRVAMAGCEMATGSAIVMDLDHFKVVNDLHGHQRGDETLIWFAGLVSARHRGRGIAARLGGEEFVLLLPGADRDAALRCAEDIRAAVAARSGACPAPVTVSMGVAHGCLADYPGLLSSADKALYRAKAGGRNRVAAAPPAS